MAAVPAPPPPPPPLPIDPTENGSPLPTNANSIANTAPVQEQTNEVQGKPGESPLHPAQLREYSKKWCLAGDSGLLLYLKDFSQRIISKTSEIDKLVESLGNATKGSGAKVHNTFNDFLMLSSNQFIENRVYEDEITEEENDKDGNEKQEKTREQLESEILPRYTSAVNFGFGVLENAFITVEVKPAADDDSDDDEVGQISSTVADPIIEPKDVYSTRPLPYLIGTAEFLHDETLGLVEVQSEDEEVKIESENEESEPDSEEEDGDTDKTSSDEEDVSTSEEEEVSSKEENVKTRKTQKKSFIEDSDESDGDLFGEPKSKKKHLESESEDSEMESEEDVPQNNFQAELASKLGLSKPVVKVTADEEDDDKPQEHADSIQENKRKSCRTKSKRGASSTADTQSIASKKSHKEKRDRTKSIESQKSQKSGESKKKHKTQIDKEEDEDLFSPAKKDDFFDESMDDGPFAKKSGLFGGGGNSLFDEDEDGLFADTKQKGQEKEETEERNDEKAEKTPSIKRTTSTGRKIPAGAVSIFGDSGGGGLFGSPEKISRSSSKTSSIIAESPPKKPPPVVKGLFDDDEDDLFNTEKSNNNLNVKPSASPRKKTLELEDEDGDLFGEKNKSEEPLKIEAKKKIPVGAVSMFGGMPPQIKKQTAEKKKESVDAGKKGVGVGLFGAENENEEEDLFAGKSNTIDSESEKHQKKKTVISLFDDDEEESENNDDDIFSGLSKVKTESAPALNVEALPKPTSKASNLFDEDDEDLFVSPVATPKSNTQLTTPKSNAPMATPKSASPVTTKTVVSADKEIVIETKSEKKSSTLFSGDGLFGGDDDLFAPKSTTVKTDNVAKSETPLEKQMQPQPKKQQNIVKAPLDPFGDDSDDDLFSTAKATNNPELSKQKKEANVKKEPVHKEPMKSTANSSSIFDDDDDLFSSPKPKTETETKDIFSDATTPSIAVDVTKDVVEEVDGRPKKPVGGVSMFGGIDPLAAKSNLKKTEKLSSKNDVFVTKKKTPSNTKPKTVQRENKDVTIDPLSALSEKPSATKPVDIPRKPDSTSTPQILKNSSDSSAKKGSNIGKLQATLNFNPSALIPGAAPPKKEETVHSISFDQPAEPKTLENLSKNRVRGQAKRRPPTRRAMKVSVDKSDGPSVESVDRKSDHTDSNETLKSTQLSSSTIPSIDPMLPNSLPAWNSEVKSIKTADIFDDNNDDIFAVSVKGAETTKTHSKSKLDDIFSNDSSIFITTEENTTTSIPTSQDSKSKADSVEKAIDDTNNVEKISQPIVLDKEKEKTPANSNIISKDFDSIDQDIDDEDIFSTKHDKKTERVEEDIFSKSMSIAQPQKKKSPPEADAATVGNEKYATQPKGDPKDTNPKQKEDDDDLFASKPKKKKELSKSKEKVSKKKTDDDLFGDSGSIFDDIPVSKDKKKKKKKTEAPGDIFATTSSSDDIFASKKTKTKKKTEKNETKSKTKIFNDDSPSVFDDPLNALGGD